MSGVGELSLQPLYRLLQKGGAGCGSLRGLHSLRGKAKHQRCSVCACSRASGVAISGALVGAYENSVWGSARLGGGDTEKAGCGQVRSALSRRPLSRPGASAGEWRLGGQESPASVPFRPPSIAPFPKSLDPALQGCILGGHQPQRPGGGSCLPGPSWARRSPRDRCRSWVTRSLQRIKARRGYWGCGPNCQWWWWWWCVCGEQHRRLSDAAAAAQPLRIGQDDYMSSARRQKLGLNAPQVFDPIADPKPRSADKSYLYPARRVLRRVPPGSPRPFHLEVLRTCGRGKAGRRVPSVAPVPPARWTGAGTSKFHKHVHFPAFCKEGATGRTMSRAAILAELSTCRQQQTDRSFPPHHVLCSPEG